MTGRDPAAGVAIVGASPDSFWTYSALRNLREYGYPGPVWPVNPNHAEVNGLRGFPDLTALPDVPDVALVLVRNDRCAPVVADAVSLGVDRIVVLSDGFAERGLTAMQDELVDIVAGSGSKLYGPNCVGFLDLADRLCAIAEPIPLGMEPGPVSFLSQSGALVSSFMSGCVEEGIGVDWCASIGNGAMLSLGEVLAETVERRSTHVVCVYAESLGRDAHQLAGVLERARELGKWVVVLKVGASEAASKIAWTHTGSMVGSHRIARSFLEEHGAIVADTFAELVRLASICSMLDERPSGGVAVVGKSGGAATLAGDSAATTGLRMARLRPATREWLAGKAARGSAVDNPFDIVGLGDDDAVWEAIFRDPDTGFVVAPHTVVYPDDSEESRRHREAILQFRDLAHRTGTPTLSTTLGTQTWTTWAENLRDQRGSHWAMGRDLRTTLGALAKLFPAGEQETAPSVTVSQDGELLDDEAARRYLAAVAIPAAAGITFTDPAAAGLAGLRPPVVVKVVATGVSHKAKLGGVVLGCVSDTEVRDAAAKVVAEVSAAAGRDAVHGVRVEHMVWGPELLVGLERDPFFGPSLTVGLGGVHTEALGAARTRLVPVEPATVRRDVHALGLRLAEEQVGETVEVIARLAEEFVGGVLRDVRAVEINPLIIGGAGPRVADIVIVK